MNETFDPQRAERPRITLPELRAEIKRLVRLLENGDRSLALCQLAFQWNIDPEHFRRLLREVGLRASRISEIIIVISSPELCKDFVLENLTWKETLQRAWNERLGELERVGARLCRLVSQRLDDWDLSLDWERLDGLESPQEWLGAPRIGGWTLSLESGVLRWEKDGAIVEMFDTAFEITGANSHE
jgi:hypothetical protein